MVEILVVLVLVGLVAGVVLPRLAQMARQFQLASNRQDILIAIDNLPYRAYTSGQPIRLDSQPAERDQPPPRPGEAAAAALALPEGWKVQVQQPIRYAFNGLCTGGELTLAGPDGNAERFVLAPPACRMVAKPGPG